MSFTYCCTKVSQTKILNSNKQKLLSVQIDKSFSLDEHVSNLCKKACQKLSVLTKLSSCQKQKRILMIVFIEAQFGYCPLGCFMEEN